MPVQKMANLQYNLVKLERDDRKEEIGQAILNSVKAGSDIKKRCNDVVHGLEESDPNINHVVEILLRKNPFIQNAQNALNDWSDYSNKIFQQDDCYIERELVGSIQ